MIYLDNAATTKPFKSVIQLANEYYSDEFYNPSALYLPAINVSAKLNEAREFINKAMGGGGRVIFTSCATESNTWVYSSGIKNKKGNIVVSMGEHASGYENAMTLHGKYDVRFVKLLPNGNIDQTDLLNKIDENTTFVSVIHCSNETGAVNDLKSISQKIKSIAPNALFHSDGVQALGKMPVNCRNSGVDLYSISAHKIGGLKGIGGLWIKDGIKLNPLLSGGGQEFGARSGTENVAGIMCFCQALKEFTATHPQQIKQMRDHAISELSSIDNVVINECEEQSPYILSFSAIGTKAEIIQRMLCERGVLVGLGSACASKHKKNRVLSAMGRSMSVIESNLRISFAPENLNDDLKSAFAEIRNCINKFRGK